MRNNDLPEWPAIPSGPTAAFVRGEGAYLTTKDGRRVLDAAGQACVSNIGYGRREIADVAATALLEMTHVLPPIETPQRLGLVEELREHWLPERLCRVHFVNSGSEAADTAIRLARQYHVCRGDTEKWKIIGLRPSYHGVTIGTLAAGGHAFRRDGFEPFFPHTPKAPACYPLRCTSCNLSSGCTLACADTVEEIITAEGADTVAAFIAEPIVGTSGGALVPPKAYWARIQEICRRNDILLIVDEVITGFGRTGTKLGIQHFGIEPDIMTMAKGLTGGYAPLAGVAMTENVMEALRSRGKELMFHTMSGHPAACAVATAVLKTLRAENLVERSAQLGSVFGRRRDEIERHPNVVQFRGKGTLWAVEVVADKSTARPFPPSAQMTSAIIASGLKRGVYFYPGGTGREGAIVVMGPAFIVTEAEIDTMLETLLEAVDDAVRHA